MRPRIATGRGPVLLVAALGLLVGAACAPVLDPGAVADAQTVARVKTALVNDPQLGARTIEVRVTAGVAALSGRVASDDELQRAVRIVRGVTGVVEVRTGGLQVGDILVVPAEDDADPIDPTVERLELQDAPSLLALGVSLSTSRPTADALTPRWAVGPLVRVGAGQGVGLAIGFSWYRATLEPDTRTVVRVRPVMAGVGYTVQRDRLSVSTSLVGGYAFNSLVLPKRGSVVGPVAVAVDNGFVLRPGVSVWRDLGRRVALNVSVDFLLTEIGVTYLDAGQLQQRDVSGNTAILQAGLAYTIF